MSVLMRVKGRSLCVNKCIDAYKGGAYIQKSVLIECIDACKGEEPMRK